MTDTLRLWHGGVAGLRIGDVLTGGQQRRTPQNSQRSPTPDR